jgi:hypothetical protein
MTRSMPQHITAATGCDALTHCLEAYISKGDHPMADGIALEGLRLTALYLERATKDGADLEARGGMMKAAMMGAVAFQKGLGACHSLAPLSSGAASTSLPTRTACRPSSSTARSWQRLAHVATIFGGEPSAKAAPRAVASAPHRRRGPGKAGVARQAPAALADPRSGRLPHQPRPCSRDGLSASTACSDGLFHARAPLARIAERRSALRGLRCISSAAPGRPRGRGVTVMSATPFFCRRSPHAGEHDHPPPRQARRARCSRRR